MLQWKQKVTTELSGAIMLQGRGGSAVLTPGQMGLWPRAHKLNGAPKPASRKILECNEVEKNSRRPKKVINFFGTKVSFEKENGVAPYYLFGPGPPAALKRRWSGEGMMDGKGLGQEGNKGGKEGEEG